MTAPLRSAADDALQKGSIARQIFSSLAIVAVCWIFLRVGSLIVSVAISHTWHPNDPVVSAYAFLFRQLIMVFLYPSVLNVFRPAFIPLYNEIKKAESREAALVFAGGVLEIGLLFTLAVFGVLWAFPDGTVNFMAPHFTPEQHAASVRMLREMAPGILCLLWAEMYLIIFHAEKKFAFPHGAEAVQKIAWGVGIVVAARALGWQHRAIGLSYSAACLIQLAINSFGMVRTFGWLFRRVGLRSWGRRWGLRIGTLALPLVVGVLGARLRDLLTHWLQSSLAAVSYVSVEFARQLTNLPVIFLGTIVSIVMLPHLASILHSNGRESHRQTVQGTVETLCLLSIPVIVGVLVLAPELMALVFIPPTWGAAEYGLCAEGALAMRMIALGFMFVVVENILMPGLFSIQSMWWPTLWGLAASVFQILCLVGLAEADLARDSRILLAGVAFVYPLSRIFKNGVLLMVLRRKIGLFPGKDLPVFAGKLLLVGGASFGAAFAVHRAFGLVSGGIPVGRSMLAYKGLLVLQLAVPSAVMAVVFAGMVLLVGYRAHLLALIKAVRDRKAARGTPAATS
ncbi:MAG: hypothetical protein GXP31_00580 [Kiritimatiellaeota bacterium]|nr:hypothetical protein [Kiritimatiellota bacterium]